MALIFDVKVFPGISSKKGWSIDKAGNLKCYIKSPAERGKANEELIKSLSKLLGISQNIISIISGAQIRNKRIKVDAEITYNKFLELLGIDWQMDVFN
jgi:uncharacterized protein (TIGR00251 family)